MIRLANKSMLKKLNNTAAQRNYNRQIAPESIERLADDVIVAVSPIMIHEHAAGKPVAPHLRCSVRTLHVTSTCFDGVFLDVPYELFELLPELPPSDIKPEAAETN